MSNARSKGKGRAVANDDDNGGQINDVPGSSPSLFSRVAASATGLARGTLSTPSSTEISDFANATLASAGKSSSAQLGQNSNSAWAETSKSAPQSSSRTAGLSSFRQANHEQHAQQADAEFSAFLDGTDPFDSFESSLPGLEVHSSVSDKALNQAWTRAQLPSAFNRPDFAPVTVAEQESRDGDAVVSFLSGPNIEDAFEAPEPENEAVDFNLSDEQISKLRALTKDLLPPPESHGVISADHPLNLNPVTNDTQVSITPEADHWREQWEAVLTRYADEVWGGLLPLVKEARQEMATIGDHDGSIETPKALRRLGAILNHLRQP